MKKSKVAPTRKITASEPLASMGLVDRPANNELQRRAMVSEAAYYRAQRRGFEPGYELEDWLAAEAEINACSLLRDLRPRSPSG